MTYQRTEIPVLSDVARPDQIVGKLVLSQEHADHLAKMMAAGITFRLSAVLEVHKKTARFRSVALRPNLDSDGRAIADPTPNADKRDGGIILS